MPEIAISVVILTWHRTEMLQECLTAIMPESLPENIEVFIGINGPDPVTSAAAGKFPAVKTVQLPGLCRGEARNAVATAAKGRWLCFLDDDTVPPPGYFTRLQALIRKNPGTAVFGGGQGLYSRADFFEELVYFVLSSPWGGGPYTERFSPVRGTRAAGPEKFILCNLTLDRCFLEPRGFSFEGHLTSAEENLLLSRMAAAGAKMVLSGDLNLVHRRRSDLFLFVKQVFGSGRGRAQISLRSGRAAAPFTLLPPLAFLSLLTAAFCSPGMLSVMAAAYMSISSVFALCLKGNWEIKVAGAALFPALHTSYACGWMSGVAESLMETLFGNGTPRRCSCQKKR